MDDDAGQYYDSAIGKCSDFNLRRHRSEIMKQDPRDCNYYGNKKVGEFFKDIFSLGATSDWNTVLKEATGGGLSAQPIVKYLTTHRLAQGAEQRTYNRLVLIDSRGPPHSAELHRSNRQTT